MQQKIKKLIEKVKECAGERKIGLMNFKLNCIIRHRGGVKIGGYKM